MDQLVSIISLGVGLKLREVEDGGGRELTEELPRRSSEDCHKTYSWLLKFNRYQIYVYQ